MTAYVTATPNFSHAKTLKPMPLLESVLLFGIPAILLAASLWWLWPALMNAGMTSPVPTSDPVHVL